ncbi:hypothetical protein B5G21_04685 [Enorma massiliensis]|uniref:Uncharacterized protein n=1 Tax=Enorma massiliensis TaxID=1472761 RepID=A0A1Y3U3R8_9ACTN|nr:hypothetical protein B5G21_04685 [Enorma massiliensis]
MCILSDTVSVTRNEKLDAGHLDGWTIGHAGGHDVHALGKNQRAHHALSGDIRTFKGSPGDIRTLRSLRASKSRPRTLALSESRPKTPRKAEPRASETQSRATAT